MAQDEDEENAQPEVREQILKVVQDFVDFGRVTNYVPLGSRVTPVKKSRKKRTIDEGREYPLPG